jgi:hypothetical protein
MLTSPGRTQEENVVLGDHEVQRPQVRSDRERGRSRTPPTTFATETAPRGYGPPPMRLPSRYLTL